MLRRIESEHAPVAGPTAKSLPYTPQPFRRGRLHGVGHPQLVSFFQTFHVLISLPAAAEGTVYMQRPNLVRELSLPAGYDRCRGPRWWSSALAGGGRSTTCSVRSNGREP